MIVKESVTNSDPKYFQFVHTFDAGYYITIKRESLFARYTVFSYVGGEQSFPATLHCLVSNYLLKPNLKCVVILLLLLGY